MKQIKLSKGQETIVDDKVYDILMAYGWKWHCSATGYAVRDVYYCKKTHKVYMHRWIMEHVLDISLDGLQADHINGNRLDNRIDNLRTATKGQNAHNRKINNNSTSGFKGVTYNKRDKAYQAQIRLNGKIFSLGYFQCPVEAAHAYDSAAKELHGEYARTNF